MWTPDRQSIVGAFNQPERYYIAAEFNATGYATGPVIGELVSELILTGKTSLPIDFYDPNRFLNDNNETTN
jgi:sarcosine oxidase subunit beta